MTESLAPMRRHHDQVGVQFVGHAHYVIIGRATDHMNLVTNFSLEPVMSDSFELGPGGSLPSWVGVEWQWNVHVLWWHSCHVKQMKNCAAPLGKFPRNFQSRGGIVVEIDGTQDLAEFRHD